MKYNLFRELITEKLKDCSAEDKFKYEKIMGEIE